MINSTGKIILAVLFLSTIFTEEIWNKKIPPSNYLKKFSILSEKENVLNFILNKITQANESNILENDSKKIILTKEENLLNYYLNQVPISKIFK